MTKLLEKGKFTCDRFSANAGESFTAYYRNYSIDGGEVELEKAHNWSNYGMQKMPEWTIVNNCTNLDNYEAADIISKKYNIEIQY